MTEATEQHHRHFWISLGRAFAGALIFSISLLMTNEMWSLGFYMDRGRLALFTLVTMVLLIGLAHYYGFQRSYSWYESVIDAFVGYAVGIVTALLFLPLFGVIEAGMTANEIVGKVALQATAGGIGALLARSQLGSQQQAAVEEARSAYYWAELFLMIVGSVFVAYTIAPTEEVILISYMMTPWHAIATVILSLVVTHAFVYVVEFRGQESSPAGTGFWSLFLRFTVTGYAAVLLTNWYILWSFGRTDHTSLAVTVTTVVVLGLPGALGAAAARLIL